MSKISLSKIILIVGIYLILWLPLALEMTLGLGNEKTKVLTYFVYSLVFLSILVSIMLGYFFKGSITNAAIAFVIGNIFLAFVHVYDVNRSVEGGWQMYGLRLPTVISLVLILTLLYTGFYYFGNFLFKRYQ